MNKKKAIKTQPENVGVVWVCFMCGTHDLRDIGQKDFECISREITIKKLTQNLEGGRDD